MFQLCSNFIVTYSIYFAKVDISVTLTHNKVDRKKNENMDHTKLKSDKNQNISRLILPK